jgi:hypothetical protein
MLISSCLGPQAVQVQQSTSTESCSSISSSTFPPLPLSLPLLMSVIFSLVALNFTAICLAAFARSGRPAGIVYLLQ